MTKIIGIIPVHNTSNNLQVNALTDVGGTSIIQHIYEQAKKAKSISRVIVATEHEDVFRHIRNFGGEVCMTSKDHTTHTEHIFEALKSQYESYTFAITIPDNELFINPDQIDLLSSALSGDTEIATLIKRIEKQEELFNPNVIKVVISNRNQAMYFSRSSIPYVQNFDHESWIDHAVFYKHIGMFAYRTDILEQLTHLPVSSLEKAESLEQIRWIENGFRISVIETEQETISTYIPDDLRKAFD
jgi:3-deoxy-manno-octulosonate cytidylyltransferase (CMP-KDO synthetase)